jgi:hypothetical protein
MIPTKEISPTGLHQKYIVLKTNGEKIDKGAEYFVLRLDENSSDPIHREACRKAVLTYASEIKNHLPELSKDLTERYSN